MKSEPFLAIAAIRSTVTISETNGTGTAGTIDEGDTLTAVTTGITPAATFTYQWYRDNEAIDSATAATYTVTAADADKTLKVVVTATGDFQGEVEAAVEVGKAVLTGTPTITGASSPAAVGDALTVSFATGTEGEDYTVVWLRDGEPIPGAEGTTYTLTAEDQGKTISVKIVGNGGESANVSALTVEHGQPADLTPKAYRAGRAFLGWNTDPDASTGLRSLTVTQDVTLYAIWNRPQKAPAPVIEVSNVPGGKQFSIRTDVNGANIYYTTDGTVPTEESALYSRPISYTTAGTRVIRAITGPTEDYDRSGPARATLTVTQADAPAASHPCGTYRDIQVELTTMTPGASI